MKICENCQRGYKARGSRQRFCEDCIDRETRCEWCGKTVRRPRRLPVARFCGKRCWGAAVRPPHLGEDNPRYNGGLCFYRSRLLICCRDGSTMPFSRGVMAAHLGRLLTSDEIVHHVNENTTDDRIENLRVVTRAEHMQIHADALYEARWGAAA